MIIKVNRGPIEGVVTYPVTCFITNGSKTCALVEGFFSYVLDVEGLRAIPNGSVTKLLKKRIDSGDEFMYRGRNYRKLLMTESCDYEGKTYSHVLPFSPDILNEMMFI